MLVLRQAKTAPKGIEPQQDATDRMAALETRLEQPTGPDFTADDLTLISRDYEAIAGPLRAFVG